MYFCEKCDLFRLHEGKSFVCNIILLTASNLTVHLSVPAIHKVGNAGISVLLKFENKFETVVININFNTMYLDK